MCPEGVATFSANGVGNMIETGIWCNVSVGVEFETTSEALSENGKYYVFTYESDPEGNAEWNLYPCV